MPKLPPHDKSMSQELSERETSVLWLVAEGLSNKRIADRLDLSEHTVKFHLGNATKKLGVSSRTKAAIDFVLHQEKKARASTNSDVLPQDTEKRDWILGFATALAQVHRHGGERSVICEAARASGVTLTAARSAGTSALDLAELRRAKVP